MPRAVLVSCPGGTTLPHELCCCHAATAACVAVAVMITQTGEDTFHPFLQESQPPSAHSLKCGAGNVLWARLCLGFAASLGLGAGKSGVLIILWLCVTAEDPWAARGEAVTSRETKIRRCFHKRVLRSQKKWDHLGQSVVLRV